MAFYTQKITSWSYSRYSDYAKELGGCPAKAMYKHVKKIKEPPNSAMERGSAIHSEAEDFVTGKQRVLSPNLQNVAADIRILKKLKASAEANWTFRSDWTQTRWDDWDGAWCRVKLDAVVPPSKDGVVRVIDYKTGQIKDVPLQMELYAVAAFNVFPEAQTVKTELWYVDHANSIIPAEFSREQFPVLQKNWEKRVKPMLSDTTFKPNPGNACRWCFFSKAKNGPCKY